MINHKGMAAPLLTSGMSAPREAGADDPSNVPYTQQEVRVWMEDVETPVEMPVANDCLLIYATQPGEYRWNTIVIANCLTLKALTVADSIGSISNRKVFCINLHGTSVSNTNGFWMQECLLTR